MASEHDSGPGAFSRIHLPPESRDLARMIDHTLLAPDATRDRVRRLCEEAVRYGFAAACVNGVWAREAATVLEGTGVGLCVVAGFPLGASATAVKRAEAEAALADGATEIDMVLDIGGLKSGDGARVERDIAAVGEATRARRALLKVIVETSLLSEDEKIRACELAVAAGADFVKTSTGFGTGGATVADVALMRRVVGPDVGVKASGGIRSLEDARALVAAGATRLGTSRGVSIVTARSEHGDR
jgi:deoxyribose-phosphate aldolase